MDFLSSNLVVRPSGESSSVNIDDQRCGAIYICFPEVNHLVGMITIRNIFVGHRLDRGPLLGLDREASNGNDQKYGEKTTDGLTVDHIETLERSNQPTSKLPGIEKSHPRECRRYLCVLNNPDGHVKRNGPFDFSYPINEPFLLEKTGGFQ